MPSSSNNYKANKPAKIEKEADKLENEIPLSGNLVTLTSVTKTNVVFIRSKKYEDNISFFKTINAVNAAAKTAACLENAPKCGQVVLTEFHGQYNRALVLNADNVDNILLIHMDYGSLDKKPLAELKEAPAKLMNIPRHALPVILKNVPECFMTDKIRWFMYGYLDVIDLKIVYHETDLNSNGIYAVELIDEMTGQNFNKTIVELSKVTPPQDQDERIQISVSYCNIIY